MKHKIIISVVLGLWSVVTYVSGPAIFVHAEETAAYHEKTVTENEAEDTWYAVAKGTYLSYGTVKVKRASTGRVNISGTTNATRICDTLKVSLYLDESSNNSSYGTIATYHYSNKNDVSVSGYETGISVTSGYYYSLRGVHSVTHNGTTETTDSCTDAITAS